MTTRAATKLEKEVNDPTTIEMKRFTRQESNALIVDLDLTMNKYEILRERLLAKSVFVLPPYENLNEESISDTEERGHRNNTKMI